jgi:hypothetical protein
MAEFHRDFASFQECLIPVFLNSRASFLTILIEKSFGIKEEITGLFRLRAV